MLLFVSKMCLKQKINQSFCLKIVKYITCVLLLECEREILNTALVIFCVLFLSGGDD